MANHNCIITFMAICKDKHIQAKVQLTISLLKRRHTNHGVETMELMVGTIHHLVLLVEMAIDNIVVL